MQRHTQAVLYFKPVLHPAEITCCEQRRTVAPSIAPHFPVLRRGPYETLIHYLFELYVAIAAALFRERYM
jgi:hypothetical protein